MVKIKEFDVKNEINEFTIEEFENVSRILNDEEVEKFERWASLFNLFRCARVRSLRFGFYRVCRIH